MSFFSFAAHKDAVHATRFSTTLAHHSFLRNPWNAGHLITKPAMAQISITAILSTCLILPTALALPQFWPHGYHEKPYPTLTVTSSDGVYPTGISGTTGTGTGITYYPTATGSIYILKRDPDHPFGYPAPTKPSLSSEDRAPSDTATSPPIPTGVVPTGTAVIPSATGSSLPYPNYFPNEQEIDAAKQARQHFEGPRKQNVKPYYPYMPGKGYGGDGGAFGGPSATAIAPTGPTGSGVVPWPGPTGTGVVPLPVPTGGSGVVVPLPSGTVGSGYV